MKTILLALQLIFSLGILFLPSFSFFPSFGIFDALSVLLLRLSSSSNVKIIRKESTMKNSSQIEKGPGVKDRIGH